MHNDLLFFKLWRNIVIKENIFKFSRLYIKNRIVVFNNLDTLREYKEKEFITTIKFKKTITNVQSVFTILKGELPEYGVLKEIDLSCEFSSIYSTYGIKITSDAIPMGVQILHFNVINDEIQLSELPSSLHTIKNIKLKKPYINNQIPENITSISFNHQATDRFEFVDIKFPNSIKELNCSHISTNSPFPPGVTKLSMIYENGRYMTPSIIPSSVTILNIMVYGKLTKGSIPFGVKDLTIRGSNNDMNLLENTLPESITKLNLSIDIDTKDYTPQIKPNTIPSGVLDLCISFPKYQKSFKGVFSNGLVRLSILASSLNPSDLKISELPKSLKYLQLNHIEINLPKINYTEINHIETNNHIGINDTKINQPKNTSFWDYFFS